MKNTLLFISVIIVCFAIGFVSCKKSDPDPTPTPTPTADNTPPVITLLGNSSDVVVYKSSTSYIDMGATANDNVDGNVPVVVTGTVKMDSAGDYTLTYTAHDAAGNIATKTRNVIVDAAPYILGTSGLFSHVDVIDGTTYAAENEMLTAPTVTKNKIYFAKFAGYSSANPYATITGNSFTIPSQTITCGAAPQIPETFVTTSAATFTSTGFTVNYTITDVNGTSTGSSVYTKL
jgi:hypothetical protein